MNREQTIEAIKVMQAWVDGKACQYNCDAHGWRDFEGDDCPWNLPDARYRIKPEPRTLYFAEFSNGMLSRNPLDEGEVSRYSDPHMIRSTKLVKFVEVMEDEAKQAHDAGLPPTTIIPPSVRPLLRHFMVGDKGKTVGGWAYNVRAATDNGHLYVEHNDNGLPSQVRRQYEMIHAKDGSAGAAGPDHQLLTPDEFLP